MFFEQSGKELFTLQNYKVPDVIAGERGGETVIFAGRIRYSAKLKGYRKYRTVKKLKEAFSDR